jgi:hypothetical protein
MNDMKNTNWTSYKQQQRNLALEADINRHKKQTQYCEWIISACAGASIALIFVLIHQIFYI